MFPSPRLAVIAVTVLLAAPSANAEETQATYGRPIEPMRLDYTIYAGGLRALSLDLRLATDPPAYRLQSQVRTTGFLADLVPFVLEAVALGALTPDGPRPDRYVTANRWRDRDIRRVVMNYGDSATPGVTAEPSPQKDDRSVVPEAKRRATVDPLTGIFDLLLARGAGCAGTAEIFDGRRRYDISAATGGSKRVDPGSYGVYSGTATLCRLSVETIGGFWNRFDERKRYPDAVRVYLADAVEGAPPVPVRIEMDTGYANIIGHLTGISRNGRASLPATGLDVVEAAPSAPKAQAGEGVR
jgi:hypothetical protein